MIKTSLFLVVVLLQLVIALTTTDITRSLAELSAFLLIVAVAWNKSSHNGSTNNHSSAA